MIPMPCLSDLEADPSRPFSEHVSNLPYPELSSSIIAVLRTPIQKNPFGKHRETLAYTLRVANISFAASQRLMWSSKNAKELNLDGRYIVHLEIA
jgi:hypothetical protein